MANWRSNLSNSDSIIIASKVRFIRNLRAYNFPDSFSEDEETEVRDKLTRAVMDLGPYKANEIKNIVDPKLLYENYILEKDDLNYKDRALIMMDDREETLALINGSDHLSLQVIKPGLELSQAYSLAESQLDKIEEKLDFAFNPDFGYLTSSPADIGTGLKISLLLHLPGIHYVGMMKGLVAFLAKLGISIKGDFSPKPGYNSNIFEISNQRTLGVSEKELLYKMKSVALQIMETEKEILDKFKDKNPLILQDSVSRSLGLLKYAKQISENEAMGAISNIRTGITTGVFDGLNIRQVTDLYFNVKSKNINKYKNDMDLTMSENEARSHYINSYLKEADIYEK